MKRAIVFLIIIGLSQLAWSQINESDTQKFQISIKSTGNYQTGNVSVLTLKGNLDLTARAFEKWVFKSQNAQLYQEFSERKADNNIFSRNYLYYNPERKLYPFGIVYASTNFRRKIESRYFIGAGLTYRFISRENHVLKFAVNAVYEETDFDERQFNIASYNGSDEVNLWRGTLYMGGWSYLLRKKIRFSYEAFYQPAFENEENFRTQLSLNLDVPVWKGLYLSTNWNYTMESVVPLGTQREDTILTFGIGYNCKSL